MAQEYLDKTGLSYFWGKIKDKISSSLTGAAGTLIPYGYCTTAAKTVAKTVTVTPAVTALTTGLQILVKFQYANTGSDPTLAVNGLTAKAIKRYGSTAAGTSAASNWNANSVVLLTYDGTYWQITSFNNTTYSALTQADATAGTATTARSITAKVLHDSIVELLPTVPTNVSAFNNDAGYIATESDPTVPSWAKASTKPSYSTSELTNDAGFITTESDPTVPSWAKASTKPAYTTSELTNDAGFITTESDPSVPTVSSDDNGKIMVVKSGVWNKYEITRAIEESTYPVVPVNYTDQNYTFDSVLMDVRLNIANPPPFENQETIYFKFDDGDELPLTYDDSLDRWAYDDDNSHWWISGYGSYMRLEYYLPEMPDGSHHVRVSSNALDPDFIDGVEEVATNNNYVSDGSYVHTDYNFSSSYKTQLDNFSNITSSDITSIINTIT